MAVETIDAFRGSTGRWLIGSAAGLGTLLLCLVGVGLLIAAARWIANMSALYEVTADRLIVRRGIIFKSIDEIELYRVKDVRVDFSLLNQMADIGRITLVSSDRTSVDGVTELADIPRARERREQLRALVEAARERRRVREIDVDADI